VGTDLQGFGIHKRLICDVSPYFKAAFCSGFEEAKTGAMKLETITVEVFNLFYIWLYSQKRWVEASQDSEHEQRDLLELYVFADMVQIDALKRATLQRIHGDISNITDEFSSHYYLPPSSLAYVWENTPSSSPLRRLLVAVCVWIVDADVSFVNRYAPELTVEICFDIMRAMAGTCQYRKRNPLYDVTKYQEPSTVE
jgi:hypothetical protein